MKTILALLFLVVLVTANESALGVVSAYFQEAVVDDKENHFIEQREKMTKFCSMKNNIKLPRCHGFCITLHEKFIAENHKLLTLSSWVQRSRDMYLSLETISHRETILFNSVNKAKDIFLMARKSRCYFTFTKLGV